MGLVEKRAVKNFRDTKFPELEKEINTIAVYPIEFQVEWDTLAAADYADKKKFTSKMIVPLLRKYGPAILKMVFNSKS